MYKELLELIAITFWQDHAHCDGDFDTVKCKGSDCGECPCYAFCQLYAKLKNQV